MAYQAFKLSKNAEARDIIVSIYSFLEIEVYYLSIENFTPVNGRLVFYGDDHGDLLAFSTSPAYDTEEITAALKWYAEYLDYPEMEITLTDPRPIAG